MRRTRTPEWMDDPALHPDAHARALAALNRANSLLGVHRQLHRAARRIAGAGPFSVLDLGAGGGGFLGYIDRRDTNKGMRIALDCSTEALRYAARACAGHLRRVAADARSLPLADEMVDVVTSSLFLHHFDPPDVIAILREAARVARRGIVMGDLTRSRAALALTWAGTRLLSRSAVFRVDGPRSVRAAFQVRELENLAHEAGLRDARVHRRVPFRMLLTWRKGPD